MYPEIDHTFWQPEVDDIQTWLGKVLPIEATTDSALA
jgi:hypothetical protein